jgi:hypothetical protein
LEPSASFASAVRERLPGVDVRQSAAERLPFPDGAFDVTLAHRGPLAAFWSAVRELDPAAAGESDLPGVREGHLASRAARAMPAAAARGPRGDQRRRLGGQQPGLSANGVSRSGQSVGCSTSWAR